MTRKEDKSIMIRSEGRGEEITGRGARKGKRNYGPNVRYPCLKLCRRSHKYVPISGFPSLHSDRTTYPKRIVGVIGVASQVLVMAKEKQTHTQKEQSI